MHVGTIPTLQASSGSAAVSTSSAWPPLPSSAPARPLLGAFVPSWEDPSTGVPSTLPEASSWRTSLAVIGQAVPSARVQSLAAASLCEVPVGQLPYSGAPHAFRAAE